jgi:hypothetical protein
VRADEPLGRGAPVAKTDQYAIEQVELQTVELLLDGTALLTVGEVYLRNRTYAAEELHFTSRMAEIRELWTRSAEFPDNVANLISEHRVALLSAGPIPRRVEAIANELQRTVSKTGLDFGILYYDGNTDVLRPLIDSLRAAPAPPEPPIQVEAVAPEDIEIRRRIVKEWKRWANSRGSASAKFRQQVRSAYHSTCLVCGLHLPSTSFNSTPGVDAAHILPWSQYDLDHVSNGLCLCKLHHWAFDEGLLQIRLDNDDYVLAVPEDVRLGIATETPDFPIQELLKYCGPIPTARLPQRRDHRPRGQFLAALNEIG